MLQFLNVAIQDFDRVGNQYQNVLLSVRNIMQVDPATFAEIKAGAGCVVHRNVPPWSKLPGRLLCRCSYADMAMALTEDVTPASSPKLFFRISNID